MSLIYNIIPKDPPRDFWLFRTLDVKEDRVVPRPEYEKYRCPSCGKLDELSALSEPLPFDLKIPSSWDMARSTEDFFFVGGRFREVYESEEMRGLEFKELPGDPRFWLAMPFLVETDEVKAGFQFHGVKCPVCGRYPEATIGPLVQGMEIPSDSAMIFSSKVWSESVMGRRVLFFCHRPVMEAFKKAKLKGVNYDEAF